MAHKLPELPFANDALEPHITARTLSFHYGKHHAGYVKKLNAALDGTADANKPLEDLIRDSSGGIYNNAAQIFNHTFYWSSMTAPQNSNGPDDATSRALSAAFGSVEAFQTAFSTAAKTHFGSGWAWLVKDADGNLVVTATHDAGCPLSQGQTPILTCDVWEHAYYLDYQNRRPDYVAGFWNLVNWDFVAKNLG